MISIHTICRWCVTAMATMAAIAPASAQYYTWGADPASLKWERIRTDEVELIYPDTVAEVARRTLHYIDAAKGSIDYGFKYPALKIPFILHPENISSNGMVMWMPKRIEILNTPAIDSYSMVWMKQLVAHEYRHAVQYNNLSQGVIRWLKYLLGDQGAAVGLALLPLYIIEGDAVMCETQMSSFGRGMQPSFTMEYRAIGREILERRNFDRWICGSYLANTPDHYHFGYQVASYTYRHYDKNIWNDVVNYAVRRPYTILTSKFALKKYYDTDMSEIFVNTFEELNSFWEALPPRANSMEVISPTDRSNYTTYSHPIAVEEGGAVVALKSDYARPSRFVRVDTEDGSEQKIGYTGIVSTRPSEGGGRMWWSEYRYSSLYSQRVTSRLCYMDLEDERQRSIRGLESVLYPTAIGESNDRLAYVEYDIKGQYSIVEVKLNTHKSVARVNDFEEISRVVMPQPTELHGLAWDDATEELYFIATDDSGMWLGARDGESYRQLCEGAYITLSDLRAASGKLYFGSIESGYDELHMWDIASGREERLSQSTYGSFDPSPSIDGYIYGTTYDKHGYHLARQSEETTQGEVECDKLPQNIVNIPQPKWDVVNLDTVEYSKTDSAESHQKHKSKRYHKGVNLVDIHSWAPIVFNPLSISSEQFLDATLGVTLISQNLLSSCEGFAAAGYDFDEGFIGNAGFYYTGLGVKLGGEVTYGGYNILYTPSQAYLVDRKGYFSAEGSASLPLLVKQGYHKGQLSVGAAWNYSNSYVTDLDNMSFDQQSGEWIVPLYRGLHKLSGSLSYTGWVSSAMRDAYSPFSYSLSASYAVAPSDRNFSDLLSLYSHITLRGILPHNTVSIAANYQNSIGGYRANGIEALMFRSVMLLPTGFDLTDVNNDNYIAASLNYHLPLFYPEGGWSSLLYLSRVRLGLGFDAARFRNSSKEYEQIYSYGANLIFDINPLRLPQSGSTSANLSLYRMSSGGWSISAGLDLPL